MWHSCCVGWFHLLAFFFLSGACTLLDAISQLFRTAIEERHWKVTEKKKLWDRQRKKKKRESEWEWVKRKKNNKNKHKNSETQTQIAINNIRIRHESKQQNSCGFKNPEQKHPPFQRLTNYGKIHSFELKTFSYFYTFAPQAHARPWYTHWLVIICLRMAEKKLIRN